MHIIEKFKSWIGKSNSPKSLGEHGEDLAAKYLKKKGYKIVGRNFREVFGEIDIVAVKRPAVVFIEVKSRRSTDAGHPADAVDENKQKRITRAAMSYINRHDLQTCPIRFDIISVLFRNSENPQIEHFEAAFEGADLDFGTRSF